MDFCDRSIHKFLDTVKIVDLKGDIQKVCFERSTIKGMFFFNGWGNEVIYLKNGVVVDFSHIYVLPTGYVIIRNVNRNKGENKKTLKYNGGFNFEYANILGTITIQDSCFEQLNFEKATIVGQLNIDDVNINDYSNRVTLTKIKNEFIKKNDTFSALKYKSVEINYHAKEVLQKRYEAFKKTPIIGSILILGSLFFIFITQKYYFPMRYIILFVCMLLVMGFVYWIAHNISKRVSLKISIAEGFLLLLNTISNKNGLSWWRGVVFTIVVATLSVTTLLYMDNQIVLASSFNAAWDYLPAFWNEVLKFIWLPDILSKGPGELAKINMTIFILGKILVGFGIYQTISAFRKYGK